MKRIVCVLLSVLLCLQSAQASWFQPAAHPLQAVVPQSDGLFVAQAINVPSTVSRISGKVALGKLALIFFGGVAAIVGTIGGYHEAVNLSHGHVSLALFHMATVISTAMMVGMSWWSGKTKPPPEDDFAWLRRVFPREAEALLHDWSPLKIKQARAYCGIGGGKQTMRIAQMIGLRNTLLLQDQIRNRFDISDFLRVYNSLQNAGYPVEEPFNRQLTLIGCADVNDEETHNPSGTDEEGQVFVRLLEADFLEFVKSNPLFRDEPLPNADPRRLLPFRLLTRWRGEYDLQREFYSRMSELVRLRTGRSMGPERDAAAVIRHRQNEIEIEARLRRLDEEISTLRSQVPEMQLPQRTSPERPNFPQHGSTEQVPEPVTDPELIEAGELLLYLLGVEVSGVSVPAGEPAGQLVVGTDWSQSAVGAAVFSTIGYPTPEWVLFTGGPGKMKRHEFTSEAAFLRTAFLANGLSLPFKENTMFMEEDSGGVIEHVNMSLDMIQRLVANRKIIMFPHTLFMCQASLQQLRTMRILHRAIKKRKLDIIPKSITPSFRTFTIAPNRWMNLGEWQRRVFFEGPREIYMILGAQGPNLEAVDPSFRIDPLYLKAAVLAGEHILADDTVPEENKNGENGMRRFLEGIREELQPSFTVTDKTPETIAEQYQHAPLDMQTKIRCALWRDMWRGDPLERQVARQAFSLMATNGAYDFDYLMREGNRAQAVVDFYLAETTTSDQRKMIDALLQSIIATEATKREVVKLTEDKAIYTSAKRAQKQIQGAQLGMRYSLSWIPMAALTASIFASFARIPGFAALFKIPGLSPKLLSDLRQIPSWVWIPGLAFFLIVLVSVVVCLATDYVQSEERAENQSVRDELGLLRVWDLPWAVVRHFKSAEFTSPWQFKNFVRTFVSVMEKTGTTRQYDLYKGSKLAEEIFTDVLPVVVSKIRSSQFANREEIIAMLRSAREKLLNSYEIDDEVTTNVGDLMLPVPIRVKVDPDYYKKMAIDELIRVLQGEVPLASPPPGTMEIPKTAA